uniref:hypothetical protein n=1 Tax=uncultured Alistipes sp. TaxID=538949 RepID=UPI00272A669E
GRKVKDLEMPITCTLFANSAADWNKQLAATQKGGEKKMLGRLRFVEIQSGFSRASRSPALRRLAKLAPPASAREQHSADRSRACELKQRALFLNKANAACGGEPGDSRSGEPPCRETAARATLRITKPQNEKKRRSNNRPQTTIPYQSSCAITPPADC